MFSKKRNPEIQLYQKLIIEHNRDPFNFRQMEDATNTAQGYNPVCGDHLEVFVRLNDSGIIEDISFQGDSCAVATASASMMTKALKGQPTKSAFQLLDEFRQLVKGERDADEKRLGPLISFSGTKNFPSRIKCTLLPWCTMKGAIDNNSSVNANDIE